MNPVVLAISGASGAIYATRLLECLIAGGTDVCLTISPPGALVVKQELGLDLDLKNFSIEQLLPPADASCFDRCAATSNESVSPSLEPIQPADSPAVISYFHYSDFMSSIASGSFLTQGMVICPCSGGTLSAVVTGASTNLMQRAAEVHLKERRKLVLVPRETPLSLVALRNMSQAAELGAIILPAMPAWYHNVQSTRDLVDFVVARILDQLDVPNQLIQRWGKT